MHPGDAMKYAVVSVLLLAALVSTDAGAEEWTGPYLISEGLGGIKPATCKEWLPGYKTCVVWEYYNGTHWNLVSRSYHYSSGWWGPTPVNGVEEAVNPSLASVTPQYGEPEYWCVWERREDTCGTIHAATYRLGMWEDEMFVGECTNAGGDSAWPSVVVISNGAMEDTVWAAWTNHDSSGWHVSYVYGDLYGGWEPPAIAVSGLDPIRHACLGRGHLADTTGCPLLVWEANGDIFYSEYIDSAWQTPQEVAHSDSLDRNPDVISYVVEPVELGPWITWESARDGDTAVYGTGMDSFSLAQRWCGSTGAGNNYMPCGTAASYPKKGLMDWSAVAWVSDRDGNANVYARTRFAENEVCLDNDTATDVHPAVTTFGSTLHWCFWQSNRGGSWNIWGSMMDATGIDINDVASEPSISRTTRATVIRSLPQGAVAFDAMGRRVVYPRPGICFVREEAQAASPKPQAVRKVVVTR